MWVYTAHGEEIGRRYGVSRPEGQQAMCGGEPVDGRTAKAWAEKNYIEWKEDQGDKDDESKND